MHTNLNRIAYDRMAQKYLASRSELKSGKYIDKFLKLTKHNSTILDVGCGSGIGVDDKLIEQGHKVIGIDNSSVMIEIAKKNNSSAAYIQRDLLTLKKGEYLVDGIICLYTLFHLPRTRHQEIIDKLSSYLKPGGLILITMGDREFEGEHMLYGERVWSSQWGSTKNREIIKKAKLEIMWEELDLSGGETHQVILASKSY